MENPFDQINNEQAGDAWHLTRSLGIGGSEIAAVMNRSPFKTAYQLWLEKTRKVAPEDLSDNYAVIKGKSYEAVARAFAEDKYNTTFNPINVSLSEYPWVRASLDGYSEKMDCVLEIKVPGSGTIVKAKNGEIPTHYMDQIQWEMLASNASKAIYMVYDPEGNESHYVPVQRDAKYQAELFEAAKKFWECVESDTPPCSVDIGEDAFREDAEEYRKALREYEASEARLDTIKERFKERIRASGQSEISASGVKVTKTKRKGAVDYGRIPMLKGINLDQFRKEDVEVIKVELV